METLLTPEGGLAGLFFASFLAATVVPFSSEAVLFGYLTLHPQHAAVAVALATAGNTLGGMTTYLLGRLVPVTTTKKVYARATRWIGRYGSPVLFFVWLPVVGDALCVAAGWLRINWIAALVAMTVGRCMRYLVVGLL